MKKMLTALIAVSFFMWPAIVFAKPPLLIQWSTYQHNNVTAEKLRLYRSVNGGPFQLHETILNLDITAIRDHDVKWQRRYCYKLFAVAYSGRESLSSSVVCAKPFK